MDDDGTLGSALGTLGNLPAAFVWTRAGRQIVTNGHVDAVERVVNSHLSGEAGSAPSPRSKKKKSGVSPKARRGK